MVYFLNDPKRKKGSFSKVNSSLDNRHKKKLKTGGVINF